VTVGPGESAAVERPVATLECNECNEAMDGAREVIRDARRLAMVAMNALLNGDPQCARKMLVQLQSALASHDRQRSPRALAERARAKDTGRSGDAANDDRGGRTSADGRIRSRLTFDDDQIVLVPNDRFYV
jgi:hypothetical protein